MVFKGRLNYSNWPSRDGTLLLSGPRCMAALSIIFFSIPSAHQAAPLMRRTPGILLLLLLITGLSVAQDIREPLVRFSHPILDRINSMVDAKRYKGAIDLSLTTADQMRAQSNWEGYISFMLRAAEIETFEVWKGKGFPGVEIYPDYRRPRKYLDSLYRHAGKIIEDYPYLKANVLFTNAVVYQLAGYA